VEHAENSGAAEHYGGGPADGDTRAVEVDERDSVVIEPLPAQPGDRYPRERAHVYRRQPDGRYRYVGAVEPSDHIIQRPD
jgi:hypothetical protein